MKDEEQSCDGLLQFVKKKKENKSFLNAQSTAKLTVNKCSYKIQEGEQQDDR
jgi:hypothetical protein